MLNDDLEHFSALWKAAQSMKGGNPTDTAVGMAFRTLRRYALVDIQGAIDAHVSDPDQGRFMVSPADVVRHIDGDSEGKPLLAWSKFLGALARPGVYESVVFDDPLIMAVIENMGGWIKWELVEDKELPFLKNDFVKLYKSFQITPPARYPNKLIGKAEAQNSITGFDSFVKPPKTIGNRDLALEVYHSGSVAKDRPQRISSTETVKAIEFVEGVSTDG